MLEALRKSATGILAKILIGLLVMSFAVWGIADVITGVGQSTIASIGDKEVGVHEFRRQYQDQVSAVSAQFGRRLTPQQARTFGIEARVLSTIIGSRAVDSHAEGLNLAITDQAVEENVRNDPLFKGAGGEFSSERLSALLYRGGLSEGQFMASRRDDLVREQLTSAMLENVTVPKTLLDIYRTFQGEQRKVRYFTIDPKIAVKLEKPTEATLKKTYDANKSRFMTDETRQVEILMITADDAKKRIKITTEQLQERYERDKLRYSVPELRQVQQIAFKDKAAATKARSEILGGKAFVEIAKANGAKETDIDLGLISKDKLIDPKIAEAAFKLDKGKVSDVVDGRFSTVLLMIKDIKPGKVPSFEDVKTQVRDSLATRGAPEEIRTLHDQVDDNRLAGKPLKEIGQLLGITVKEFPAITRADNGSDGKPVFTSPDRDKIMTNAFDSAVGVENEVVELADGGYAWVRVLKITKAKQKTFDAVKADTEKLWRENETSAALTKLAVGYVGKLKTGTAFKDVAKSAGGEMAVTPAFKRADSLPNLTPAAVNRAFALKKGVAASAKSTDGKSRIVFEVTDVAAPEKLQADAQKQLEEQLENQLRTDVVAQYVVALRNRLGVETNQRLIDQTVGILPAHGY